MKKLSAACFISALLFLSCNSIEPPVSSNEPELKLEFLDVSCTEAWIKISTSDISLPANIKLLKNDNLSQIINLISPDTILYVDSLLPKQTYHFKSSVINRQPAIESNQIEVNTMDTTSHDFTWQTYTFGGQAGSCVLNDCSIISPDDIWCVGEINIADTSINGYTTFNAVHWDGNQWLLKRIRTIFRGNLITVPLEGIFAFSETDIWMVGSLPIHGDGENWVMYDLRTMVDPNLSLSKVWGSDTNDMYFVGRSGSIAHYQNGQWSKIESGTDANINDILGLINENTNERKIFCAIPSGNDVAKRKILTIDEENKIDSIHWIGKIVNSTWTPNGWILYTSGDGIYNNKSGFWEKDTSMPYYYTQMISGNSLNDIFVCGNYGFLAHFNGKAWKMYQEFLQLNTSLFGSIASKDNIVVAVGFTGESALIVMGRRN